MRCLVDFWCQPPHAKLITSNAYKFAFSCAADAVIDADLTMARHFARTGAFLRQWAEVGRDALLGTWRESLNRERPSAPTAAPTSTTSPDPEQRCLRSEKTPPAHDAAGEAREEEEAREEDRAPTPPSKEQKALRAPMVRAASAASAPSPRALAA